MPFPLPTSGAKGTKQSLVLSCLVMYASAKLQHASSNYKAGSNGVGCIALQDSYEVPIAVVLKGNSHPYGYCRKCVTGGCLEDASSVCYAC